MVLSCLTLLRLYRFLAFHNVTWISLGSMLPTQWNSIQSRQRQPIKRIRHRTKPYRRQQSKVCGDISMFRYVGWYGHKFQRLNARSQKASGCRCIIDQYLLAAVAYAQQIIDNDKDLRKKLRTTYNIDKPHIGVFTEVPVPNTMIKCTGTGMSYTFHGFLDYATGFIHQRDIGTLLSSNLVCF